MSKQIRIIEIPVGPQHPAIHEPIQLRIWVDGEEVVNVKVVAGFNHRGVEWLAERKTWHQNVFMCSRICGICNTIHGTTCAQCFEDLGNIEVPPRARYLRVLVNELERIHSHMIILAIMAEAIGFETLFMLMMRDRERVMYLKELVTGNRVLADYVTIGGVRRDITTEICDKIKKHLNYIEERMKYYKKVWSEDPIILKRLVDTGRLTAWQAIAHCVVGPMLRGSGVKSDIRKDYPYAAYDEVPFNVITYKEGDSWARMMVRVDETFESINMVRYVIEHLPSGPILPKVVPKKMPPGEGISKTEAPRGELIYHAISKGGLKPYRLKVRTPSFTNIHNGAFLIKGAHVADVPVIFTSFDPCIACCERVKVIDVRSGRSMVVPLKELNRLRW